MISSINKSGFTIVTVDYFCCCPYRYYWSMIEEDLPLIGALGSDLVVKWTEGTEAFWIGFPRGRGDTEIAQYFAYN